MLVYDPIISWGKLQLTYNGKTKVYRNGDVDHSLKLFSRICKFAGTVEEFEKVCEMKQTAPCIRESGCEEWSSRVPVDKSQW